MTKGLKSKEAISWAILVAAAVVVWTFWLGDHQWESCAEPNRVFMAGEIPGTSSSKTTLIDVSGRNSAFGRTDGTIRASMAEMNFYIVRSRRPAQLAAEWSVGTHRPPTVSRMTNERREIDGQPFSVRWAEQRIEGGTHLIARIGLLGSKSVESLVKSEVMSSVEQLKLGRFPMTLYVVEALVKDRGNEERARAVIWDWLSAAVRHDRDVCGS